MCHTPPGVDRAPTVEALRARGAEAIINALTTGVMQVEGQDLTPGERAAIAAFVAGAPAGGVATPVSGRAQRM